MQLLFICLCRKGHLISHPFILLRGKAKSMRKLPSRQAASFDHCKKQSAQRKPEKDISESAPAAATDCGRQAAPAVRR
jgi:hypothetical protein